MRPRSTWLATLLTAAAVAVPCAAWYVAGHQATERQAETVRAEPHRRGHEIAAALSERLVGRLEAIRDIESQRPFYQYQGSFHDPSSNCQCAATTPSPLAVGLRDPFIQTHFQIDPFREVTLPALDPELPALREAQWYGEQERRLDQIRESVDAFLRAVGVDPDPSAIAAQGLLLDPSINAGQAQPTEVSELLLQLASSDPWLEIEPFQWHSLALGGDSTLVALRRIGTTRGPLVQGFVLAHAAIDEWLRGAELSARLRPVSQAPSPLEAAAPVVVDCSRWEIAVDVGTAVAAAERSARRVERSFARTYAVGSSAVLLAGLSVVLLLWQTERAGRQRARFAAAAAHELRTPLAGLQLYGDMLAEERGDPRRHRQYAGRIRDEAQRLGRVVSNVMNYTQIERGNLRIDPRPGDLQAAVVACVDRLQPMIGSAGAELILETHGGETDDPAADHWQALFDTDALEHILQNFVDNAEKYGRAATDRRIHIELRSGRRGVEVAVRDHGPGIGAAVARSLFRPFERPHVGEAPAGLGLGLVLARNLARAHGSEVRWENVPSGGARFSVEFPRH